MSLQQLFTPIRFECVGAQMGVTSYAWSSGHGAGRARLMLSLQGSVYVRDGTDCGEGGMRCIYDRDTLGPAIDPQLSPNGKMVAFVVDGEIFTVAVGEGGQEDDSHSVEQRRRRQQPTQLTSGARENGTVNGLADFVSQEEMGRHRGFWWSPDSRSIAFTHVDQRHIPTFRIVHQGKAAAAAAPCGGSGGGGGNSASGATPPSSSPSPQPHYEDHHYPFAGAANPVVRLGVVRLRSLCGAAANNTANGAAVAAEDARTRRRAGSSGGTSKAAAAAATAATVVWMEVGCVYSDFYLARVHWLRDGSLGAEVQRRDQKALALLRLCPDTGNSEVLLEEHRETLWVNLHHLFRCTPAPVPPPGWPLAAPLPPGSFSFVWGSERTRFMHLYLYTYIPPSASSSSSPSSEPVEGGAATLVGSITAGDWLVESVVGIDQTNDSIYFTSTAASPLERHLYRAPLVPTHRGGGGGGPYQRLTTTAGMHSFVMDHGCRRVVTLVSVLHAPPHMLVHEIDQLEPNREFRRGGSSQPVGDDVRGDGREDVREDGGGSEEDDAFRGVGAAVGGHPLRRRRRRPCGTGPLEETVAMQVVLEVPPLSKAMDARAAALVARLSPPEMFSCQTRDGSTTLHGCIYLPDPAVHGPGPYPTCVAVYGGPHVQRVARSWAATSADLRAQWLRQRGFCVLKCDNRGSSRRGLAFEAGLHLALGQVEVRDQEDAVRWAVQRRYTDPSRVGIYGWSYGGYLAAMCLCQAASTFRAAVAGAPVTSWDGYDTHYTERYMGTPAQNAKAYHESSVCSHVHRMKGKLMLVHGLIDENVHFRHTARLINALTAARKHYDLLVFPDERHSPKKLEDRIYMEQRIAEFLTQSLKHPSIGTIEEC